MVVDFFVQSSLLFCKYISALVNCGDPGILSNGRRRGSRYWTGESVSFVCEPQYYLTGPATRMCLPSGNWTGVQPSCKYNVAKNHQHDVTRKRQIQKTRGKCHETGYSGVPGQTS